jgi:thymidylate kinase
MLVVLEGIDGSGKTTTADLLVSALAEKGISARCLSKTWADFPDPFVSSQMARLREIIWNPPEGEPLEDRLGTHFYLFLLAAWWSVMQAQIFAKDRLGCVSVIDGWYFRTVVKACVRGHLDTDWLLSLFDLCCSPDLVVLLDVAPSLAWGRRAEFKPSESGLWDGHTGDEPLVAYCKYQEKIRSGLLALGQEKQWFIVEQSEKTKPSEVCDEILSEIERRFVKPEGELL